jgi:hypothetical protein
VHTQSNSQSERSKQCQISNRTGLSGMSPVRTPYHAPYPPLHFHHFFAIVAFGNESPLRSSGSIPRQRLPHAPLLQIQALSAVD